MPLCLARLGKCPPWLLPPVRMPLPPPPVMGESMAENVTDADLWGPSDAWLASLIRHLMGWARGTPVPLPLLRQWRAALLREARRVARARAAGREPYPPAERAVSVSAGDVVADLLRSPEGQIWMGIALAMPAMLAGLAAGTAEVAVAAWRARAADRRALLAEGVAVRGYLDSKLGGQAYQCPAGDAPHAVYRAAANAVTPSRARAWRAQLAERAAIPGVLAEMAEVGRAASVAAHPLRIWYPEPGPPRGVWPDPPAPLDDVPPVSEGVAAGERPSFIPGRS